MKEIKKDLIYDEMSEKIISVAEKMVTSNGAHAITVRSILKELEITNRVFYNRFRNIDEVLSIVYQNTIIKIRDVLSVKYDIEENFFEYVMHLFTEVLKSTYDLKMKFSHYMFEHDSISNANYSWWTSEIKKLIEFAKTKKYIKDVDSDVLSYSIWCFCRGFNADAVSRNIPKEKAVSDFQYSFGFLLDGLKENV